MKQLYGFEIFVESIQFLEKVKDLVSSQQITISVQIGNVVKVDIRSDLFAALDKDNKDKPPDLFTLNCGKSVIFSSTEKDLIGVMNEEPFSLKILVGDTFLASMTASWTEDFYSLLKRLAEAEPNFASMSSKYKLMDTDELMGHIKARVRLTLHGNSIESNFRIMNSDDISTKGKQYLIKNSSRSPVYGYNKTDGGDPLSKNEALPMCPMISPNLSINTIADPSSNIKISFTALFSASFGPNLSVPPDEFSKGYGESPCNYSRATFDILSIVERPDEKKYFDLHIRVSSAGFSFYLDKEEESAALLKDDEEDLNDLTVDKINNMLCKSKDCPAARMFKKFGIGPLATVNNLGAALCPVSPPSKYGLSQTYGTLDDYGAYGILHSQFDESFDKERNALAMYYKYKNKQPNTSNCSQNDRDKPLRLRGGGLLDYDNDNNPFAECRQVMAQFDHVLEKFKRTMGPCGKPTCPFAPNIIRESCKNICRHPMDFDVYSDSHVCPVKSDECLPPPSPPPRPVMTHGACGSPKCPYSKYKAGMMEEDDLVDLEFVPPTLTGRCGMPKCPFPPEPELPPIHWDCPEALPTGPCKNPDCPHKPKDLSILKKVMPQSYCGNPGCPYKIPPPCQSPDCPFNKPECPYEKQREAAGEKKSGGPNSLQNGEGGGGDDVEDVICENPDCPYAAQEDNEMCENPDCPFAPRDDNEMCENPDCPYTSKNYIEETCANPDCPFAVVRANSCRNPSCPYVMGQEPRSGPCTKTVKQTNSVCENPDCPAAPKSQKKATFCGSPSCPFGPEDDMPMCYSPAECPVNQNPSPCLMPSSRDCYSPPPPEPMGCPVPVYFPCGFPPSPCGPKIVACYPPPIPLCGEFCPYPMGGAFDLCLHSGPCPFMSPVCKPPICPTLPPSQEICAPAPAAPKKPTKTSTCFIPCDGDDGSLTNDGKRKESLSNQSKPSLTSQQSKPYRKAIDDDEPTTAGILEYSSDTRLPLDSSPCYPGTCQAEGGNLVCTECTDGAVKGASGSKLIKTGSPTRLKGDKKKKKKEHRYKHKMGEKYTGVKLGHRDCCMPGGAVPGNMGWLWNIPCIGMKPRRGWKPGAVGKSIAETILRYKETQGLMKQLDAKRKKKKSAVDIRESTKPTLKIQKREGCYWITMNPLKDPFSVKENENPYMDCTPMQFKIVKNKDEVNVRDGDGDYKTCYCGDGEGDGSNGDTSGSELDIEFTPPAAIVDPKRFRIKKEKADNQTQYLASDVKKEENKAKKGKKGKDDKKGKKGGKKGKKK